MNPDDCCCPLCSHPVGAFSPAQLPGSTSGSCCLRTTSLQRRGPSGPAPNAAPDQSDGQHELGQLWSVSALVVEAPRALVHSHHLGLLPRAGQGPGRGPAPQSGAQQPFQMAPPPAMGQPQRPPGPQSPPASMLMGQPTAQMGGPAMGGPPMGGSSMAGSPMGGLGSPFPGPSPPGPGAFQPGPGAAGFPHQAGMI